MPDESAVRPLTDPTLAFDNDQTAIIPVSQRMAMEASGATEVKPGVWVASPTVAPRKTYRLAAGDFDLGEWVVDSVEARSSYGGPMTYYATMRRVA